MLATGWYDFWDINAWVPPVPPPPSTSSGTFQVKKQFLDTNDGFWSAMPFLVQDHNVFITAAVMAVVFYVAAPLVRRLLAPAQGAVLSAVPTVICSKCGRTSTRFTHPQQGGALCSRCANWE